MDQVGSAQGMACRAFIPSCVRASAEKFSQLLVDTIKTARSDARIVAKGSDFRGLEC